MLVINPTMNTPIEITDTVSGIKWQFVLRYNSSGKVSITIDAPKDVVIYNTAKTARKQDDYESQRKF